MTDPRPVTPLRPLPADQLDQLADLIAARLTHPKDRRPFFTTATLADYLSLSERTVKALLADGKIPSYRFEGSRRIAAAAVDAYVAACRDHKEAA